MAPRNPSRREFLIGTGAVATIGLAGCLEDIEEEARPKYTVTSIEPPAENAVVFRTLDDTSPAHVFRVTYDVSFPENGEPSHIFLKHGSEILEGFDYSGEETVELEVSDSDLDERDVSVVCSAGEAEFGEVAFTHNPVEADQPGDGEGENGDA